ncbi:helix-turn-helix transcriptional regulator [Kordia jejudonensis]|uniref:helix-turn-helix transcriptional regulator n=1 Tax=Kordia jejudonensis TaxID=1348245 RepID=UPI0006292EEF|nr:AraC family transcriptional regulator [Kordia jejudonensis]
MEYKEFLPSTYLEEIIQNYWVFNVLVNENVSFPVAHETLPESTVSIVFIQQPYYKGIRILGPRTKKFNQSIFPNSIYFGIRLHPWLAITPDIFHKNEIINETIDASSLITNYLDIDKDVAEYSSSLNLVEKDLSLLFDTLVIQKDDLVKFICLELTQGIPIRVIIEKLPFSVRVIQKRFKAVVGISMRQFASNIKQRNLWIDLLENQNKKTDVIYKYNYFDQSHFINEFKRKMKRSASDYEAYLKTITISLV